DSVSIHFYVFFFIDSPTTATYTLSLHDALPISCGRPGTPPSPAGCRPARRADRQRPPLARRRARLRPPIQRGPTNAPARARGPRSEEHTSELQSRSDLVCRLLLEKKKKKNT